MFNYFIKFIVFYEICDLINYCPLNGGNVYSRENQPFFALKNRLKENSENLISQTVFT